MSKHRKKADPRRLCLTCENFKPTGREQHGTGYVMAGRCQLNAGKGQHRAYVHGGLSCLHGLTQPPVAKSGQGDRFHALF